MDYGMRYDICTRCKSSVDETTAVFFRYCHHIYCVDCIEKNPECKCHPNGIPERIAENKKNRRRYRLLMAIEKNIEIDLESDDDEVEVIPVSPVNEESAMETDETLAAASSHQVRVVEIGLQNAAKRLEELFEDPTYNFQSVLQSLSPAIFSK